MVSSNSVCNHASDSQIGLPLRGRPILLNTRMITDRIGLHSVLLPLFFCGNDSAVLTKKHFFSTTPMLGDRFPPCIGQKKPTKCFKGGVSLPFKGSLRV